MTEEIKLKITKNEPYEIELENENGDTFTFNPQTKNGEELYDFLIR